VFDTLRFRLAFWHALIYSIMALVIFVIAYQTAADQLLASINADLQDTAVEFSDLYHSGGIQDLRTEVASESRSHDGNGFFARYLDAGGHTVMNNHPAAWTHPIPKPDLHGASLQWFDVVINDAGDTARVLAIHNPDQGWMQIGQSLHAYQTHLSEIIRFFF